MVLGIGDVPGSGYGDYFTLVDDAVVVSARVRKLSLLRMMWWITYDCAATSGNPRPLGLYRPSHCVPKIPKYSVTAAS